ncbi:TPA: phage tail protein [Providencia alcalifaciens]
MKYFALLTTYGEKVLAEATALGTKIELTHMSVGDGGGSLPAPDTKQTKLINERRKAAINTLFIDPLNPNQIIAEQVIPENEGGWWIREIGLFDKSGALVAIANCPETYKPLLVEGSGRTQTIRVVLIVSHTESVTLKIDPTVVLATRKYVDDAIQVLDKRISDLTASDVGAVPTTRKVNNKALSADITLNASDVSAVPTTRKVNNKTLNADITLNASDVSAVPTTRKVNDKSLNADITLNASDVSAVPTTRKVNNKPLSADITLNASDVKAIPVDLVGNIGNGTKMASADKNGWWLISVSDTSTVSDFPKAQNGEKLYGYGYMFVENNGTSGFQHYYSHRGTNAKRQAWNGWITENTGWTVEYNTSFKPSAADVGALTEAKANELYPSNKRFKVQGSETQVLNGSGSHYLFINENVSSGVYGGTSFVWGFNGSGLMTAGLIPLNCGGTGGRGEVEARKNLNVYSKVEVDEKIKSAGISAVRLGSEVSLGKTGAFSLGNGEVVTGLTFWETGSNSSVNFGGYRKRAIQYNLNGTWVNAASV